MKKIIIRRPLEEDILSADLNPILKRIYAARGIRSMDELENGLEQLASFDLLANIDKVIALLVQALVSKQHIMVIGDFDADGATSTALAVKCLRSMGFEKISYLVPNRFEYGYGLTPEIVEVAAKTSPHMLLTVDNGISSHEGVEAAHKLGIKVVITDHHLPAKTLPEADAIINPNLPQDSFPSKNLAGVGVIFYVMLALRAQLRVNGWFQKQSIPEPNMASFLDLVALGTVADVVPLDKNNRILVYQGIERIKNGKACPGIKALLAIAGRNPERISATDLGFAIAPRLNAAGRLVDMSLGIECLLSDDEFLAKDCAFKLDSLNKERQQIEAEMREQAVANISTLQFHADPPMGVCLFDESWHQGIIGILASRVKDLLHRPVFAFALANDEELKGSGRSITGLHLKDILEQIAASYPGLIKKFGGHAMAAGMSLDLKNYQQFSAIFNQIVSQNLSPENVQGIIHSDGELSPSALNIEMAEIIQKAGPWGQNFPEPIFDGQFKVVKHRILKEKHLKLVLSSLEDYFTVDAMAFNIDPTQIVVSEDDTLHIAYRLDVNEYKGNRSLQLLIEHLDVV